VAKKEKKKEASVNKKNKNVMKKKRTKINI
jgi:hypothetical protein